MLPANNIGRCRFPILGGFFRITNERIETAILLIPVYIYTYLPGVAVPLVFCIFFPPKSIGKSWNYSNRMSTIRCPAGALRLMRERSRDSSSSFISDGRLRRYNNIETRGCLFSRRSLDMADVLAKGVTV